MDVKTESNPRFLKQKKDEENGFLERILEECKKRLHFKIFRMKIINEFILMKDPQHKLDFRFLEISFPFLITNSLLLSFYFSRHLSKFQILTNMSCIFFASYTFLCVAIVGEKEEYMKNSRRLDYVGFYLRSKFINQFPNHYQAKEFKEINERFFKNILDK